MKKIFSHAVKALLLLLVTAVVSPAGEAEDSAAQQAQTMLEAIRNSGRAPDACSLESFNELGERPEAKGVADQSACKNFYSHVCDSKRHDKRQKSVDRQVETVVLQTIIDLMSGDDKIDAQNTLERLKNSTNPKDKFEAMLPKSAQAAFQEAKGKVDPKEVQKKRNAFLTSVTGSSLKQKFDDVRTSIKNRLTTQPKMLHDLINNTFKDDPDLAKKHQFVDAAFKRMSDALDAVELDQSLAPGVCIGAMQKNALFLRQANGKAKVVVCPGTALGTPAEVVGALAGMIGHAVDMCALDQMSVGSPRMGLSGLYEPYRACMGNLAADKKDKTRRSLELFGAETLTQLSSVNHDSNEHGARFNAMQEWAGEKSGFATLLDKGPPASPHCAKPFTGADLKAGLNSDQVQQRDQSNDLVASRFMLSAVDDYFTSKDKNYDKRSFMADSFAAYCDSVPNPKGTHPKAEGIVNALFASSETARGAFGCAKFDKKRFEEADGQRKKVLAHPGTYSDKNYPTYSCMDEQVRGLGYSLGLLKTKEFANQSFERNDPDGWVGGGKSNSAIAGGEGDPRNARSAADFGALSDQDFLNRNAARDLAIDEAQTQACRSEGSKPGPSVKNVLAACRQLGQQTGRVEVDYWPGSNKQVTKGDYTFEVGCQSRCLCTAAQEMANSGMISQSPCYLPEATYVGQAKPKVPDQMKYVDTTRNRVADDALARYQNQCDASGTAKDFPNRPCRYGIAYKACYLQAPDALPGGDDALKSACSSPDAGGKAWVRGRKAPVILETSHALVNYTCNFQCDCSGKSRCVAYIPPPNLSDPSIHTATEAEVVAARQGKSPGKDPIEYAARPAMTYAQATDGASAADASVGTSRAGGPPQVPAPPPSTPPGGGGTAQVASSRSVATNASRGRPEHQPGEFLFDYVPKSERDKVDPVYSIRNDARNAALKLAIEGCGTLIKDTIVRERAAGSKVGSDNELLCGKVIAKDFTYGPIRVASAPGAYRFSFSCSYNCNKPCEEASNPKFYAKCLSERSNISFVKQEPPSETVYPLDTVEQVEKARAADWQIVSFEAQNYCDVQLKKMSQIYADGLISLNCTDPKAAFEGGGTTLDEYMSEGLGTRSLIMRTQMVGEFSGASIPFKCGYKCGNKCDCKGKKFSETKALPVRLNKDSQHLNYSEYDQTMDFYFSKKQQQRAPQNEVESNEYLLQAVDKCRGKFPRGVCTAPGPATPGVLVGTNKGVDLEYRCHFNCAPNAQNGGKLEFSSDFNVTPGWTDAPVVVTPMSNSGVSISAAADAPPPAQSAGPPVRATKSLQQRQLQSAGFAVASPEEADRGNKVSTSKAAPAEAAIPSQVPAPPPQKADPAPASVPAPVPVPSNINPNKDYSTQAECENFCGHRYRDRRLTSVAQKIVVPGADTTTGCYCRATTGEKECAAFAVKKEEVTKTGSYACTTACYKDYHRDNTCCYKASDSAVLVAIRVPTDSCKDQGQAVKAVPQQPAPPPPAVVPQKTAPQQPAPPPATPPVKKEPDFTWVLPESNAHLIPQADKSATFNGKTITKEQLNALVKRCPKAEKMGEIPLAATQRCSAAEHKSYTYESDIKIDADWDGKQSYVLVCLWTAPCRAKAEDPNDFGLTKPELDLDFKGPFRKVMK